MLKIASSNTSFLEHIVILSDSNAVTASEESICRTVVEMLHLAQT